MWLNFKRLGADIICLQETHLTNNDRDTLIKEWNIEFIISGNSTNSRGVAILINKTFEYKVESINKDSEGRYIMLNITINNSIPMLIVNLYGHNNDNPNWYDNLLKKIEDINIDYTIIVGDWNIAPTKEDTYNYNSQRNML